MDFRDEIMELMPTLSLQTNNTVRFVSLRTSNRFFPRQKRPQNDKIMVQFCWGQKQYFGAQLCDRRSIVFLVFPIL